MTRTRANLATAKLPKTNVVVFAADDTAVPVEAQFVPSGEISSWKLAAVVAAPELTMALMCPAPSTQNAGVALFSVFGAMVRSKKLRDVFVVVCILQRVRDMVNDGVVPPTVRTYRIWAQGSAMVGEMSVVVPVALSK